MDIIKIVVVIAHVAFGEPNYLVNNVIEYPDIDTCVADVQANEQYIVSDVNRYLTMTLGTPNHGFYVGGILCATPEWIEQNVVPPEEQDPDENKVSI